MVVRCQQPQRPTLDLDDGTVDLFPDMAVLALYGAAEISRQLPGLQDVMEEAQPQPAAQHLVGGGRLVHLAQRSEEHTSELQSLMRISYAVFCLTKKKQQHTT